MNLHLEYKFNRISNEKKCIVFLHGWGMNQNCFDKVVSNLGNSNNILSLDFFGFGKSSEGREYFDTYEYAYYVYCLLKKLKMNSVILFGHSFGGRVALLLSSIFDINIEYLVLTSSAGVNYFDFKKEIRILKYKVCKFLVKHKLIRRDVLLKFGSDDYKKCNDISRSIFVKVVNQDLKKHLKKVNSKTLLVWDKKDKITPYKICKVLNKNIVSSQVVLFKSGGHFTFLNNTYKISKLLLTITN